MARQKSGSTERRALRDVREISTDEVASFSPELLDELAKGLHSPEQLEGAFRALKKGLVERMLGAELTAHLGYAQGEEKPVDQVNYRNGSTPKTVLTDDGELPLDIP